VRGRLVPHRHMTLKNRARGQFLRSKSLTASILAPLVVAFAFAFPSLALADYTVFQNIWPAVAVGGVSDSDQIFGMSTDYEVTFLVVATSSPNLMDRIGLQLCQFGGSDGGFVDVQIRYGATTSSVFASSSVAVNSANIFRGSYCNTGTSATTTIFTLNNSLDYDIGSNLYISLRTRSITGTIFVSYKEMDDIPDDNFYAWFSDWSQVYVSAPFSRAFSIQISGYANGLIPPDNEIIAFYGSTTANIVCTTFEIDCYLAKALRWAFYPTVAIYLFNETPPLASTTPFAYIFESIEIWDTVFSGSATGTQDLQIDFAPMGMSTTSLVAGTLASTAQGKSFFTTIRSWIEVFLWFIFAFGILKVGLRMIGWADLSGPNTPEAFNRGIRFGKAKSYFNDNRPRL